MLICPEYIRTTLRRKASLRGFEFLKTVNNSCQSGTRQATAKQKLFTYAWSMPVLMQALTKLIKETNFSCVHTRSNLPLE